MQQKDSASPDTESGIAAKKHVAQALHPNDGGSVPAPEVFFSTARDEGLERGFH